MRLSKKQIEAKVAYVNNIIASVKQYDTGVPSPITLDITGGRYRLETKNGSKQLGPRLSGPEMMILLDGMIIALETMGA